MFFHKTKEVILLAILLLLNNLGLGSYAAVTITEKSFLVHGAGATSLQGPQGVYVLGGKAYVVSSTSDSLSVFDISDPTSITELGTLVDDVTVHLDGANSVYVSGNYAYVTSNVENSLAVFDISDPANITEVSSLVDGAGANELDGATSVYVSGTKAYVASSVDSSLSVFNVSNPLAISESGTITDAAAVGNKLDGASSVVVVGNTAYVTSPAENSLATFDVSDPAAISQTGAIVDGAGATELAGATSVAVSGTKAYVVSSGDDSLSIFDVSNPAAITELGTIVDNNKAGIATQLNGANGVFVSNGYAYVASIVDNSLSVFDVSSPTAISEEGVIVNGSGATNLSAPKFPFLYGDNVYVTSGSNAISAFNVLLPIREINNSKLLNSAPVIKFPVNNDVVNSRDFVLYGTASKGVNVTILNNGVFFASTFSSAVDGTWKVDLYNIPDGQYFLRTYVNGSSDTSGFSDVTNFTVDTRVPTPAVSRVNRTRNK